MNAILYIDETGKFQPLADDSRSVGGLLIDESIEPQITKIHQDACDAISWPARLHAAEFGSDGGKNRYLRAWFAKLLAQNKTLPACLGADATKLMNKQAILTHGAPHVVAWPRDIRNWQVPRLAQDEQQLLSACGAKLRNAVRQTLKDGLQAACSQSPVYFVAGHTDDKLPAEVAYRQCAAYAIEIVKGLGIINLVLHFAKPELGTKTSVDEIWSQAAQAKGLTIVPSCHNYDTGPPGLWVADSLLHWAFQAMEKPLLLPKKHGLSEKCLYVLSTEYAPPLLGPARDDEPLRDVCQRTQKLLGY